MKPRRVPNLSDAVRSFLTPIMAEGCRVVDEYHPETPVTVSFGPCTVEMKLADLKQLSDAFRHWLDAHERRAEKRARGSLL